MTSTQLMHIVDVRAAPASISFDEITPTHVVPPDVLRLLFDRTTSEISEVTTAAVAEETQR